MTTLYPMLIKPRLDERIWGGDLLATRLGKDAPRDKLIGESWEIYEENTVLNGEYAGQTIGQLRAVMGHELTGQVDPDQLFPLLTKFIDAHDVLSVQVHPDDHFAQTLEHQRHGKTECWYVLWAEPGSALTYGFSRDTSPDEYTELVRSGQLDQVLRSLPVKAGDVVYIPAGTVHAIGAGVGVYELQQTSDVTYRIYDWNRRDASGQTRRLHVDQARQVLDYHRWTRGPIQPLSLPGSGRTMLIAGEYFCQELIDAARPRELSTHQSAVAVATLDHSLSIRLGQSAEVVTLPAYASLLVPAAAGAYTLQPAQSNGAEVHALVAYVPPSGQDTTDQLRSLGCSDHAISAFLAQFAPAQDLGQPAAPDRG